MKKFIDWLRIRENNNYLENFKLMNSKEIVVSGRSSAFAGDEGTKPYVIRSGPKGFPPLPDPKVAANWGQSAWEKWAGPGSRIVGYGSRDASGKTVIPSKGPLLNNY